MQLVVAALQDINSESDSMKQRDKVLILGSNLSNNQSLSISGGLKTYVYNILSNISFVGDSNLTKGMISNLHTMFEVNSPAHRFSFRVLNVQRCSCSQVQALSDNKQKYLPTPIKS